MDNYILTNGYHYQKKLNDIFEGKIMPTYKENNIGKNV